MKRLLLMIILAAVPATWSYGQLPPMKSRSEMKADFERSQQEFRRAQIESQRKFEEAKRAAMQPPSSTSTRNVMSLVPQSKPPALAKPQRLPSMPPAAFVEQFIRQTRSAGSMNQLLGMMSLRRRESLVQRQKSFNPREAAETLSRVVKSGAKLSRDDMAEWTMAPYTKELTQLKQIANRVVKIGETGTLGTTTSVVVFCHNPTANDGGLAYSKGAYTLVAEGNSWRFDAYQDTGMQYSSLSDE